MTNHTTTADQPVKAEKPMPCKRLPAGTAKADLIHAHKQKMDRKTLRRERDWLEGTSPARVAAGLNRSTSIAQANRRDGKRHKHEAEIARRLRQKGRNAHA